MSRMFFVLPDAPHPQGGINVSISFAEILKRNGVDTFLLFDSADYHYPFLGDHAVPTTYTPQPNAAGLKQKIKNLRHGRVVRDPRLKRRGANELVTPKPDDIFVLPEYSYDRERFRFPVGRHVLLCQGYKPLFNSAIRMPGEMASQHPQMTAAVGTSEISMKAVAAFSGCDPFYVPLFLERGRYQFCDAKKKKISYMPRRRTEELNGLVTLLQNNPAMRDYEFVAIDGVPAREVDRHLTESLIFLSGSQRDGFGMPPAEAMAMGCITIGYTGVGGDEFFTRETGFPIPEDDTVAFYETVVSVAQAYAKDPSTLDQLRAQASEAILGRYTVSATETALMNLWRTLELSAIPN